jgi:hypothetical protein
MGAILDLPANQQHQSSPTEYFLSTLQNMGVKFQHAVENFHQGEV